MKLQKDQQVGSPKIFMKTITSSFMNDSENGIRGEINKKEMFPGEDGKMVTKEQK